MDPEVRSSLDLLYRISRELTSALDLNAVLAGVLRRSLENLGAERGSLIALDTRQQPVNAAILVDDRLVAHTTEQLRSTLEGGLAGWVMRARQAVSIADTSRDERWQRRPDDEASRTGPKSVLCVPLIAHDELAGVLTVVHPKPNFFNNSHLELLQAIADQAGIAIRNAQLYESLQAAHQRYRELFEDSIDPIFITTLDGVVLESNRQAGVAFQTSPAELFGRRIQDLHQWEPERTGPGLERIAEDQTVVYTSALVSSESQRKPVEVRARVVQIGGERSLQWILRDISERVALESLRDDLNATVYHDLRSPLSNIISSLDMIGSMMPPNASPALPAVLQIAVRSTDRLQRLISSLLDINRLEAGQPLANRKVVSPSALAAAALEAVEPLADGKEQTLDSQLPPNLPDLWVDEDMVRRVLINLMENACKYTPTGGQIHLGGAWRPPLAEGDHGWVDLWVQDNGPGIPTDALEIVFNKFSRLQAERFPKGFGLGLAFCRLAVHAHGGEIHVESEEGVGSRFIFSLPAA